MGLKPLKPSFTDSCSHVGVLRHNLVLSVNGLFFCVCVFIFMVMWCIIAISKKLIWTWFWKSVVLHNIRIETNSETYIKWKENACEKNWDADEDSFCILNANAWSAVFIRQCHVWFKKWMDIKYRMTWDCFKSGVLWLLVFI